MKNLSLIDCKFWVLQLLLDQVLTNPHLNSRWMHLSMTWTLLWNWMKSIIVLPMLDQDPVHLIVHVAEFGDADANPQGKQKKIPKLTLLKFNFFVVICAWTLDRPPQQKRKISHKTVMDHQVPKMTLEQWSWPMIVVHPASNCQILRKTRFLARHPLYPNYAAKT